MNTHNIKRQFSLLRIIAVCTLLTGGTIKPSGGPFSPSQPYNPPDKIAAASTKDGRRTLHKEPTSELSTSTKLQQFIAEKARSGFSLVKKNSWHCSMIATAYGSRSLWQDTFTSVVHTSATVAFNCIKENRSSVVASIAYLTMESSMHLLDLLLTTLRCTGKKTNDPYGENYIFNNPYITKYRSEDMVISRDIQAWNSILFEWFKIIVPLAITLGSTYYSKDNRSTKAGIMLLTVLIKGFNDRTVLQHLIAPSSSRSL